MLQKDTFKKVELVNEWSKGTEYYNSTCSLCHNRNVSTCLTEKGRLCTDCVAAELKKMTADVDLKGWTFEQVSHILNSPGNIRWRLMLLWKFEDVLQLVSRQNPENVDALLESLIHNLKGVDHPLVHAVLQAAMQACIRYGKELLPLLFQKCKPEPWDFYANIITCCANIAPEEESVQNLVKNAASHSQPMVRKQVIRIIASQSFSWEKEMLYQLARDKNKSVADFAAKVIADLDEIRLKRTILSKGISENEFNRIMTAIDREYNTDTLKKIYQQYLRRLFESKTPHQKKGELIYAVIMAFTDKDLFDKLFSSLPEDEKRLLHILVWEGEKHSIDKLEKIIGIKMVTRDRYSYTTLCVDYPLFQTRLSHYYDEMSNSMYLPNELRKLCKRYLPKPEAYNLIPLDSIEKTDFIHIDDALILRQLSLFAAYIKQGNLKLTQNQAKVMKPSLKEMIRCCQIKEFYENKELEYIKTQMIVDFLRAAKIEVITDPIKGLKRLFDVFFSYNGLQKYQLRNLLSHLKGDTSYFHGAEEHEKRVRLSLLNLLKAMNDCCWHTAENMLKYCCYRDIDMNLFSRESAGSYLYYNKTYEHGGYRRVEISEWIYRDAVINPLIKAAMFLFSAFGLVDIAYNLPKNPFLQDREKEYLSVFDGLQYIRLTKLGAYVLGLTNEYKMEEVEGQKANLILDEERLLIHIEGEDVLKRLALEKIGEKLSNAHYRVDYNSFLKGCFCEEDILQKITLFKDYISLKPPQIWQNFLSGILKKINPLSLEEQMVVYKLTPDKELISLMATDEVLKKHVLKAENYRILINATNLNKIKKRLGELGYFVERL